jgi:hypothetical protein
LESLVPAGKGRPNVYTLASIVLLAVLFAANVYRARTQSITVDEAFTYNHYVAASPDPTALKFPFNENLNTQLSRWTVRIFGLSEFSLRLPSVLGGLLYFLALLRLCRFLFGDSPWLLLAISLNSLNPFLLDYLSAARGYSTGLAFWTLGAYYIVRYVSNGGPASLLWRAALPLGLAIGSHVTETFGVAALELACVAILVAQRPTLRLALKAAVPMFLLTMVVAAAVLWAPLHRFSTKSIDDVVPRYAEGLRSLVSAFVLYRPTWLTSWEPVQSLLHRFAWTLLVVLLAGLVAAGWRIVPRWRRSSPDDRVLVLLAGTLLVVALLLWIEPRAMRHAYWAFRRLLFTLPLTFTAFPLWIRWLWRRGKLARGTALAGVVALAALAVNFALEFNVKSYLGWEFDAGTSRAVNTIRGRHSAASTTAERVGVTWFMNESFNFYRAMYGLSWMAKATRDTPAGYYDYYYVVQSDLPLLQHLAPQELYRDPTAGTILAVPGAEVRQRLAELREIGFAHTPPNESDVMAGAASVEMGTPDAKLHLLRDFLCVENVPWCWTGQKPAILFNVVSQPHARFKMDFAIDRQIFAGPVRLTVWLNNALLGEQTYDSPGAKTFEEAVPSGDLRSDGVALIETTLNRYYVPPSDRQKLGYQLIRAGFFMKP